MGQLVVFSAAVFGPKETTNFNGSGTLGPVRSTIDGYVVMSSLSAYWHDDPNNSAGRAMEFNGSYSAGYHPPSVGPYSRDSGIVVVDQTVYGQAQAFITLTGTSTVNPGFLVVPSGIYVSNSATFRAVTDVDTNAYHFSWQVDGQDIPGNDDARLQYAFSLPGNHEVVSFAHYLTGTETIRSTVFSAMVVQIDGPSSIDGNSGMGHWEAVIPGGFPPYSYQWYIDGVPTSTNSFVDQGFDPATSHEIEVSVSDSHGYTAYGVHQVYVTAGGTCLREPCP